MPLRLRKPWRSRKAQRRRTKCQSNGAPFNRANGRTISAKSLTYLFHPIMRHTPLATDTLQRPIVVRGNTCEVHNPSFPTSLRRHTSILPQFFQDFLPGRLAHRLAIPPMLTPTSGTTLFFSHFTPFPVTICLPQFIVRNTQSCYTKTLARTHAILYMIYCKVVHVHHLTKKVFSSELLNNGS